MFSSVFATMYGTYFKREFQHTYDAILAAPVDTEELVTGEVLWVAARAGVYGSVPMLVAMVFGLDPAWGMFAVPLIAFITGFGWAAFGVLVSAIMKSADTFSYITSIVVTPAVLVAGTYFPLSGPARVGAGARPVQPAVPLRRARPPRRVRLGGLGRRRPRRRDPRLRPA